MDPFAKPPTISDDYRMADIYRQSAEVFYVKGFEAASMAEIAESVDLTKGGLYYYIKGKKALLYAIMGYGLDLLDHEVLHPARRLENPETCLYRLIEGYVRLVCEEPSVMAMVAENEGFLESEHASRIRSRKLLCSDFLCDLIASLLVEAHPPETPVDPKLAAAKVLELVHTVRRWNEGELASYESVAEHIVGQVLGELPSQDLTALAS